MASKRLTAPLPKHRILREVYRNYSQFKDYVTLTGEHVIDHGYFIYEDDLETVKDKISITISFWDLEAGLEGLSKRKHQAVMLNVISDQKQKDVADIMGITTVSVGQYVDQSMIQIAKTYFGDD